MKTLLRLAASFLKIGLFTFGGGLSMFPMLEREVIARRGWHFFVAIHRGAWYNGRNYERGASYGHRTGA
ncbi:MAG: chromate transporter [Oscillospiraceae bacterium]|nr:chromate transporter [Oscillospiraceae bacterium]